MKSRLHSAFFFIACIVLGILIGRSLRMERSTKNYLSLNKLDALLNLISTKYVEKVDEKAIIEELIPQVLDNLDPHSVYIPASEVEQTNENIEGSFSGIGIQFNIREDTVRVVAVITGGPAEQAGLKAGDRIVSIEDSSFVGSKITNNLVMKKLRGEKGSVVHIGIYRNGSKETLKYTLTRNDIPVNSVDATYKIEDNIAYIKIGNFSRTTYNEVIDALNRFRKKEGCDRVILDLRGNPGGLMGSALSIINEFLPKQRLMLYVEGKSYPRQESFSNGSGAFKDMPIVILMDEWSASASEIVAGSIQDNDRGYIVGRRSFGKGLVQQQIPFKDGSAVRLTVAHYYIPSGRNIQKPYKKGDFEDYELDLVKRYDHGEFSNIDSIKLNDSLRYETIGGRTVYGGGGIMPDFFVPIDTSENNEWYTSVTNKSLVYNFAASYADAHREVLSQFETTEQLKNYLNRQHLFDAFVSYSGHKGVKQNTHDIRISEKAVKIQLYAYIARNTMDENAFWKILQENDKTLGKAVSLIKDMSNTLLTEDSISSNE